MAPSAIHVGLSRWGQSGMVRALCLRLRDEQDASNSN